MTEKQVGEVPVYIIPTEGMLVKTGGYRLDRLMDAPTEADLEAAGSTEEGALMREELSRIDDEAR